MKKARVLKLSQNAHNDTTKKHENQYITFVYYLLIPYTLCEVNESDVLKVYTKQHFGVSRAETV